MTRLQIFSAIAIQLAVLSALSWAVWVAISPSSAPSAGKGPIIPAGMEGREKLDALGKVLDSIAEREWTLEGQVDMSEWDFHWANKGDRSIVLDIRLEEGVFVVELPAKYWAVASESTKIGLIEKAATNWGNRSKKVKGRRIRGDRIRFEDHMGGTLGGKEKGEVYVR